MTLPNLNARQSEWLDALLGKTQEGDDAVVDMIFLALDRPEMWGPPETVLETLREVGDREGLERAKRLLAEWRALG